MKKMSTFTFSEFINFMINNQTIAQGLKNSEIATSIFQKLQSIDNGELLENEYDVLQRFDVLYRKLLPHLSITEALCLSIHKSEIKKHLRSIFDE